MKLPKIFKRNKENINNSLYKLLLLLALLIVLVGVIPMVFSRYESKTNPVAKPSIAFYVLKAGYQVENIDLPKIEPRTEPYVYVFTISNNDGKNRAETDLKYDLSIRTTTNLPLNYRLYLNEDYNNTSSSSIVTEEITEKDEYETYFKYLYTASEYFSHTFDEVNTYTLVIEFPINYNSEEYQDILENIEIIVDSKQKLEGEI